MILKTLLAAFNGLRLLLAIATEHHMHTDHADISQDFTQGTRDPSNEISSWEQSAFYPDGILFEILLSSSVKTNSFFRKQKGGNIFFFSEKYFYNIIFSLR